MRVVSSPRYQQGRYLVAAVAAALPLSIALAVVLVFAVGGVAAAQINPSFDIGHPFRW